MASSRFKGFDYLIVAGAILYAGGWQPIWKFAPKDTVQLALQNNITNDGHNPNLGTAMSIISNDQSIDDAAAENVIGNYFISQQGLGILVNNHYYGAEITTRFFNSISLSWISFFVALSVCGGSFLIIF